MIIYAFIGAIKYLRDSGNLDDVVEISCSSAGAMIGFFYVFSKGDVDHLLQIALDAPLIDLAKPDIKSLLTKFGLIDADRFEKFMVKAIRGANPTFKELYDMNPIKLHIPTYDIVMNKTIYMSVDTTPDMKVAHAVRRSIAIPIIMTPVLSRYIDGSVAEYSPHVPFLGKTDVFEIRFTWDVSPGKRPKTFFQFLYSVITSLLSTRHEYLEFPRLDICTSREYELFNFSMDRDQKLQLYKSGYYQAKQQSERSLAYCHSSRDSYSADPKSPACLPQPCKCDPEPQSEDQHHLGVCVTEQTTDPYESSSPVLEEMHQSSPGTSQETSCSNEDS
jgi:predicted acylesterase/phospholipase RssA